MDPMLIGGIGIIFLLVLFFLGVPIGFAMAIAGIAGFAYVTNPTAALKLVGIDVFTNLNSFTFSALPMFIAMGCLAFSAGVGRKAYDTAYVLMGRFRGGLVIATTMACTVFGAVCGSSAATCVAIGKTAIPEMKKHNYNQTISLGALTASGALGFMIPPSIPMVVYAILTEQSVGKLFMAGIFPGIMQMALIVGTTVLIGRFRPDFLPRGEATTAKQKVKSLLGLSDALILFVLVIGGLYTGFFGPTTAGAIGAAGAIVIGLVNREMTWSKLVGGLQDSLRLACMILILIIGAIIFGHFITATNVSAALVNWAKDLHPLALMSFFCIVFFILGAFLDETPLLLLLVPLVFPLVEQAGYDPIWFGVIVTALCMLGIVTPPVATNLFVVKGMVGDEVSFMTISKGTLIYLIPLALSVVILIAVPQIATFLPQYVK